MYCIIQCTEQDSDIAKAGQAKDCNCRGPNDSKDSKAQAGQRYEASICTKTFNQIWAMLAADHSSTWLAALTPEPSPSGSPIKASASMSSIAARCNFLGGVRLWRFSWIIQNVFFNKVCIRSYIFIYSFVYNCCVLLVLPFAKQTQRRR